MQIDINPETSTAGNKPIWIFAAILVAIASTLLNWQGWKNQWEAMDDRVINIDEAYRWLHEGRAPVYGGFATTGGFTPPGISYLFAMGLWTDNFLLHERVGPSVLHLLTLVGIWLLTKLLADRRTAFIAIALYAFSDVSFYFGTSVWVRSSPCGYVWTMYFLVRWACYRSAWRGAAILSYVISIYIYLECIPAALAFLIAWWSQRPPIRFLPVLVAILLSVGLCYPYLEFEWERGFSDLRMQLITRGKIDQNLAFEKYADLLESYDQNAKQITDYKPLESEALDTTQLRLKWLFFRVFYFTRNQADLFVFEGNYLGYIPFSFFMLPIIGWSVPKMQRLSVVQNRQFLQGFGALLLGSGLLANPWVCEWLLKRDLERQELFKVLLLEIAVVGLAGCFLLHRRTKQLIDLIVSIWRPISKDPIQQTCLDLVMLMFIPVWLGMAIASMYTRYFLWLWSIQVIILALAAWKLPAQRWSPRIAAGLTLISFLILATGLETPRRITAWRAEGFAGHELPLILTLDDLASEIKQSKLGSPHIGYHFWFGGYELLFTNYEDRYKLGAPQDQYLAIQHGIHNLTKEKLGYSRQDQYRVIQAEPKNYRTITTTLRTRTLGVENYHRISKHGSWELWKRN